VSDLTDRNVSSVASGKMIPRAVCFLAFVCLSSSLVILIVVPPAQHYEISIYRAYPFYFWVAIACPFVISVVYFLFTRNVEFSRSTKLLVVCSFLASMTLLLLSAFRAYAFFNPGDSLTHVGFVKDILATGNTGKNNPYPITHILTSSLCMVLGVEPWRVILFTPQMFTALYAVFMFLLARALRLKARTCVFVFLFAILPLYGAEHLYYVPSGEAIFLLPIVMWLIAKRAGLVSRNSNKFSFCLVLFLILFPFFHVEASLFLLIGLVSLAGALRLIREYPKRSDPFRVIRRGRLHIPILILFAVFLTWFSTTLLFGTTMQTVFGYLFIEKGTAPIEYYAGLISMADVQPGELARLLIGIYGVALLSFSVAIIPCLASLWRYFSKKAIDGRCFATSIALLVLSACVIPFLVMDFIIGTRSMRYLLLPETILICGWLLRDSSIELRRQNRLGKVFVRRLLVLVVAVLLASLSIQSVYPSPWTKLANYQVTEADLSGMTFFLEHRNESMLTMEMFIGQKRFADAILGVEVNKPNIRNGAGIFPLDHFGYNASKYMGTILPGDEYLLFNGITRIYYPEIFPGYSDIWRFTPNDFAMIEMDQTVNVVCTNGEFQLIYILGIE